VDRSEYRRLSLKLSVLRPGLFELGVEFVDLVQTGAEQDFQPYVGNIGNIKCTGKI